MTPLDVIIWACVIGVVILMALIVVVVIIAAVHTLRQDAKPAPLPKSTPIIRKDQR